MAARAPLARSTSTGYPEEMPSGDLVPPANGGVPTGTIAMFAGAMPSGWLECDGAAVSRITYAALYAYQGATWGAGDGSTTFNTPDLRGRTPVGAGTGSGLTARTLGGSGGEESHQLTTAELPSHTHGSPAGFNWWVRSTGAGGNLAVTFGAGTVDDLRNVTTAAGSDTAHNNMPPYRVVRYGVKT